MFSYPTAQKRIITAALAVLLGPTLAGAQDISTYTSRSAEELLSVILNSSSETEKIIISSYLAKNFANSVEGTFAQAVLARRDEQEDKETRFYENCLAMKPNFLPALFALAVKKTGKDRIELFERILGQNASWHNFDSLEGEYFTYAFSLKDQKAADDFLRKWEQTLPNLFKFDLIRAKYAESTATTKAERNNAALLFLKAIEKNPDDLEAYVRLASIGISNLRSREDLPDLNLYIQKILKYLEKNPASTRANILMGDVLGQLLNLGGTDLINQLDSLKSIDKTTEDYYLKAYESNKTAENANRVYQLKMRKASLADPIQKIIEIQDEAYKFLLGVNIDLPQNQFILNLLGRHAGETLGDKDLASSYYEAAIKYSYTQRDEVFNAKWYSHIIHEGLTFEYEKASKTYLSYIEKGQNGLLYDLFINRRNAQDFTAATTVFNEFENYNRTRFKDDVNESLLLDFRGQLQKYALAEERMQNFYKENPFLRDWQNKFGDSLKFTINFGQESVELPRDALPGLSETAKLLREKGGKYIFSIEGHSEGSEADKSLSLRRAEAVRAFLETTEHIARDRMRIVGYESKIPVIANAFVEGQKNNRRVEIIPLGRLSKPTIFPTSALNADGNIAVSPDGKRVAIGSRPIQLWDLEKSIKLKDLGRGGSSLKFSPNGRYLATSIDFAEVGGNRTYALLVYDVKIGRAVEQIPWSEEISNFDWDPTSQKIVFTTARGETGASWNNKIIIHDVRLKKNVLVKLSKGLPITGGDEILWSRNNKYIVAGRPWGTELQLYDPTTLNLIQEIPGVNYPHALAQTTGGKYLICADNSRTLSVWDTTDWSRRQMKISTLTNRIGVHPNQDIVVLNDGGVGGDLLAGQNHSLVVDLKKLDIIGRREIGPEMGEGVFSIDGSQIYLALKDKIEVLDALSPNLKTLSKITGPSSRALASSTDTLNNYYLSADESGIHAWEISSGTQVNSWSGSVKLFSRMGSDPDNFVFATEDRAKKVTKINVLNTSRFEKKELLSLNYVVDKILVNSLFIAFAVKEFQPNFVGNRTGKIEIYDRKTLKLLRTVSVVLQTRQLEFGRLCDAGFSGFDIAPTGDEAIMTTYWQDGFGHEASHSNRVSIINLSEGEEGNGLSISLGENVEVFDVAYDKNNADFIAATMKSRTVTLDKKTGKALKWSSSRYQEKKIHLPKSNADILWSASYLRLMSRSAGEAPRLLDFDDNLIGVEVFEDKNLLISINSLNEIVLYDLSRFEKVLTIVPKVNREWIAYAPSGYFVASLNGPEKVFWSLGDDYLEFSALVAMYEDSKIIADTLKSISKGDLIKNNPKGPAPSAYPSVVPYTMTLLSRMDVETQNPTYKMEVRVDPKAEGLPEPTVRFSQDHRNYPNTGVAIRKEGNSTIASWEYTLNEGKNFLEAFLDYGGVEGIQTRSVSVNFMPKVKLTSTLWFVGIGVEKEPLQYPADDVECLAKALKLQEGKVFHKVETKIITDEAKDQAAIQRILLSFLSKTSSSDTVIIYISGHGVSASNGMLFFVPQNGDVADVGSNVSLSFFSELLQSRPEGQKAVFLMDICRAGTFRHPGNVQMRGNPSLEEATKALARGTGLFVLAATSGTLPALESPAYKGGHGAFAAAILEALDGSVDPTVSFPSTGYITVNDLGNYVKARVPLLTDGGQTPTSPTILDFIDYPLAARQSINNVCLLP